MSKHRKSEEGRPPKPIKLEWQNDAGRVIRSLDGLVVLRAVKEPEGDYRLLGDLGTFRRMESARTIGALVMQLLVGQDGHARSFSVSELDLISLLLAELQNIDIRQVEAKIRQLAGTSSWKTMILTDQLEEVEEEPNNEYDD